MQKNIIISLILSVIIALFAILNAGVVSLNLIFIKLEVSAALVILISACIGAIIVYSINMISTAKDNKIRKDLGKRNSMMLSENDKLQSELDKLNKEIVDLKNRLKKSNKKEDKTNEKES